MCANPTRTETITTASGKKIAERCCACGALVKLYQETNPLHGCLFYCIDERGHDVLALMIAWIAGERPRAYKFSKGGRWGGRVHGPKWADQPASVTFASWAPSTDELVQLAIKVTPTPMPPKFHPSTVTKEVARETA